MYSSSTGNSGKKSRWKRTLDGHLTRQSTSTSSTTVTNDEPSAVSVSKIRTVSHLNSIADSDQDQNDTLSQSRGIYFDDGFRRIDFVLVFEESLRLEEGFERHMRRQFFEENLAKAGLMLEEDAHKRQATESSPAKITVFVKVHAPWSVLCRKAEALKMRMPLQLQDAFAGHLDTGGMNFAKISRLFGKLCRLFSGFRQRSRPGSSSSGVSEILRHPKPRRPSMWALPFGSRKNPTPQSEHVTWPFLRKRIQKYLLTDVDTFFSSTQRMEIVWEILQRARNDPNDEKKRGIESLLGLGVYQAAFPLHDGSEDAPTRGRYEEATCDRQRLKMTWASWGSIFHAQPIELIRSYFGEKVAFYFSFLGFYTKMLVFPAIFGVGAFVYGIAYAEDDEVVLSVCDGGSDPGNRMMCPVCNLPNCDFNQLSHGCWNAVWEYRVDNEATVLLACFTVIWATVFLKLWKRREAELAFEWDTYDVELEDLVVRPAYEERATSQRPNPVTREIEPYVPASARLWRMALSICVTAFMLCGVGAALFCLIFARIQLYGALNRAGVAKYVEVSRWTVHALTFIVVTIFEQVYNTVAEKITSWECPRTQSKWLSSYLWKVFVFQLLNDFVPIAYASWVKGKTASPSKLSWSSELCEVGGCMSEATELIAVLLLARLVIGNSIEIGVPFFRKLWSRLQAQKAEKEEESDRSDSASQWHQDILLDSVNQDGVAQEYMEMVIQFAFCTLFVPAFPAAPIVCLLNNIFEIRVDAINFIAAHRRPVPIRVPGIEIWNSFLDIIAKLAILCNAGLISFTSEIVPRLYYKYQLSPDGNFGGYPECTLSFVRKEEWGPEYQEHFERRNLTGCWYEDRLNDTARMRSEISPEDEAEDQLWWEVMTMRIVAFALFAISSFTFQWLFNFIVPDTPSHVITKIQRRRYVVMKAMETEIVYDRWLKHAVNATSVKQQRAKTVLDAFVSLGHHQKAAASQGQANGDAAAPDNEEEGEHLEPMSNENMKKFVHKRH